MGSSEKLNNQGEVGRGSNRSPFCPSKAMSFLLDRGQKAGRMKAFQGLKITATLT